MSLSDKLTADYRRYGYSAFNMVALFRVFYVNVVPGLKFITVFRALQYFRRRNRLAFIILFLWYRHLKVKYGFDISYRTEIGMGLYIGHFGGIVIHGDVRIGNNCNLSQGITLGISNRGANCGTPVIGNNVFIGPGAKVFGGIRIGNNSAIGANAVVLDSFEDYSVIAGIPGKHVSNKGSEGYIQNPY